MRSIRNTNFKKTFILTSIDKENKDIKENLKSTKRMIELKQSYHDLEHIEKLKPIKNPLNMPKNIKSKYELSSEKLII